MKRVLIIGCCGAGKSTLSLQLAQLTGLPLIHLDKEYFLPGWVCPEEQDWVSKVETLISRDEWIIEGNYAGSLDARLGRADTVIILSFPVWKCLFRVLWRTLCSHGKTRTDMAKGCPERFDLDFIKYVISFPKNIQPRIDAALKKHPEVKQIILKNDKETAQFLAQLINNKN